jgi:hypothetical protein
MMGVTKMLSEGLRASDLEDLILPMISIDQYESKIDNSCIVLAFFVSSREPAKDLNRFIQRTSVGVIDTEVSPASDNRGYFRVYVELLDNEKTARKIVAITEEVSHLCGVKEWKIRMRHVRKVFNLDEKKLELFLGKRREVIKNKEAREASEDKIRRIRHREKIEKKKSQDSHKSRRESPASPESSEPSMMSKLAKPQNT